MESPGVNTFERDRSFSIIGASGNASAMLGLFRWGPVNQATQITTNEDEVVRRFGKPNKTTSGFFLSAANFLRYANPLYIVRAVDPLVAKNASDTTGVLIKNNTAYESALLDGLSFVAKYPGELGNSLKVSVADDLGFSTWQYASSFNFAPDTNEVNVAIIDEDGLFTGTAGQVLETFSLLTFTPGSKKSDGTSSYIKTVLEEQSQYVYLGDEDAIDLGITGSEGVFDVSLTGGVDGNDIATADFSSAYNTLTNQERIDIISIFTSFLPAPIVTDLIELAETRTDCKVFVAPELSDVYNNSGNEVDDLVEYFNTSINKNTSYGFTVDNWKLVYDKYNDEKMWIPCDSDAAGLEARTFIQQEAWFSFAGLNRGQLRNVIRLAWDSNKAQRDILYRNSINSIVAFDGEGTVLFGDKTMLRRPSAFSRINVRNLLIVIKKSISRSATYQLFEFNDNITRSTFKNSSDRYLENVQGRRGIRRFKVICDTTNNTPQVIDANEFVGDILIDPARSINNIRLNFTAVGAGVSFEEIEGEVL